MALNLKEGALINLAPLKKGSTRKPNGISDSQNLTGIELRIANPFIKNNTTPKVGGIFPGFAKMYMVIVVVSDVGGYLQTLDLKPFPKVNDNECLPIDKTIYYWKQNSPSDKAPSQVHALVSIVKSKQKLREVGKVLADVKNDGDYASLVTTLSEVVKTTASVTQISNIVMELGSLVGKYLGKVEDVPLITCVHSFTDINGDFDQLGVTPTKQSNQFAEVTLNLVVRDKNREIALASLTGESIEELEIA